MATPNITPERADLGLLSLDELAEQHRASSSEAAPNSVNQPVHKKGQSWTEGQKILFRIAFVFFISMSLPNNIEWYKEILEFDWLHLHYRDLYDVARFGSGLNIFGNKLFGSTLNGYATWIITLIFATVIGLIWTAIARFRNKEAKEYNLLYYWLRVVVRYRAGIGIIGFGFTKLMPTQLPYPSLGLLNTNFGDLTAQKIYWLSIGIVPWYEVFTGVVEVLAGALLFFRATTFWGSVLLFGALADIVYVNFAYDGGVHGYSSYFVLLSGFLLIYYIKDLYNLLIRERLTVPNYFAPTFSGGLQYARISLKTLTIGLFLVLLFWLQYVNFRYDPYKQPAQKGLKELRGNYNVTEFQLNGKSLPFSPVDSVRWQEATFENWTTLTFKVAKPVELDLSNGGGSPMRDINRTFELTGVAGGQRVFYYEADTKNHVLYLQDKNRGARNAENREFLANNRDFAATDATKVRNQSGRRGRSAEKRGDRDEQPDDNWIPAEAKAIIGPEDLKIDPIARSTRRTKGIKSESRPAKRNRMVLHYTAQNNGDRVILRGINEKKDSIYVVLDRANRKYALSESTLKAGTY
ncbi:hypothetical protein IC229_16670 [Spirosoma sp. BT702]|uniref:DoxX family protein n=1 Tax=Spirosoma profusum TaxID=2771354 RepID=A0A926XWT7_9BACT|nr:hypothetical protein [Spirosoma profusum]MBD2702289.1 hypothetical protein [Spirosoma profusum]